MTSQNPKTPQTPHPNTHSSKTQTTAFLFLALIIFMPFLAPLLLPILLFTLPTGEENNA